MGDEVLNVMEFLAGMTDAVVEGILAFARAYPWLMVVVLAVVLGLIVRKV